MTAGGDGGGEWIFAVIPGAVYNAIRRLVVDDSIRVEKGPRKLFDAIVIKTLPEGIRNPNNSLSYERLLETGFQYRLRNTPVPSLPDRAAFDVAQLGSASAVAFVVSAYEHVIDIAFPLVELALRALAEFDRLLVGSVDVDMDFDIMNVDNRFPAGVMRRHWGPSGDDEQSVPEATVTLLQVVSRVYALGVPLPTIYSQRMNDVGRVHFEVAQNGILGATIFGGLCVDHHNNAARIVQFAIPSLWCRFPKAEILDGTGTPTGRESTIVTGFSDPSRINLRLEQDDVFAALAEFSDSRDYSKQVLGLHPAKAHVLVGLIGNLVSFFGTRAWTPCMRVSGWSTDDLTDYRNYLHGYLLGRGFLNADIVVDQPFRYYLIAMGASDIILPNGTTAEITRGVYSHEYGHFAVCNYFAQSLDAFGFLQAPRGEFFSKFYLTTLLEGADVDDNDHARVLNEGLADFFAGQVVGGVNYWAPSDRNGGYINFCNASGNRCLDENSLPQNTPTTNAQIARFGTALHDVFDGHYTNQSGVSMKSASPKRVLLPSNADYLDNALAYTLDTYGDQVDENVRLSGSSLGVLLKEYLAHRYSPSRHCQ